MEKILEKVNKLSLPVVILIVSIILGGFYFASQINKQKSIEKQQKIDLLQKQSEQKAEETKDQNKTAQLAICLANAEFGNGEKWYNECRTRGELTNACIALNDVTFDQYLLSRGISKEQSSNAFKDYYTEKTSCYCKLPYATIDRLDKSLEGAKVECKQLFK